MKVLLFCAKGFETMEFSVFVDVFGWAENDYGYPVHVVTCGFQKEVVSTFHVPIIVDRLIGYEKMQIVRQAMGHEIVVGGDQFCHTR